MVHFSQRLGALQFCRLLLESGHQIGVHHLQLTALHGGQCGDGQCVQHHIEKEPLSVFEQRRAEDGVEDVAATGGRLNQVIRQGEGVQTRGKVDGADGGEDQRVPEGGDQVGGGRFEHCLRVVLIANVAGDGREGGLGVEEGAEECLRRG